MHYRATSTALCSQVLCRNGSTSAGSLEQLLPHSQRLPLAVHIVAFEDSATMSLSPNLIGQSLWFLLLMMARELSTGWKTEKVNDL